MSTEKQSFLKDENSTGFCVSIFSGKGESTHISFKSRAEPGKPLTEVRIDDASDTQLYAICNLLDNL